jgi:hypothetical protein
MFNWLEDLKKGNVEQDISFSEEHTRIDLKTQTRHTVCIWVAWDAK